MRYLEGVAKGTLGCDLRLFSPLKRERCPRSGAKQAQLSGTLVSKVEQCEGQLKDNKKAIWHREPNGVSVQGGMWGQPRFLSTLTVALKDLVLL